MITVVESSLKLALSVTLLYVTEVEPSSSGVFETAVDDSDFCSSIVENSVVDGSLVVENFSDRTSLVWPV